MTTPDRILEQTAELIRRVAADTRERTRIRRWRKRRQRRVLRKVLLTGALMAFTSFVIVVGMISLGLLFGPRGVEGLLAAPLLLIASWAAILYRSFGSRRMLPLPEKTAKLIELPAQTQDWLEEQRRSLPFAAQRQLEAIAHRLDVIAPQLAVLDAESPAGFEVRRLVGEELPELIRSYQKVPTALQRQPLHGGASPDRRLIEGLATIDEELGRMHSRLAVDDLHALATQQRYLEIKYKGKLE